MFVKSCASIIKELFQHNGGWKRLQGELAIYYWPVIVGEEIASITEATFYRDGYLFIKTENPALAQQLSLMQTDILKKYYQKFGKNVIRGVKVKVGSVNTKKVLKTQPFLKEVELTEEEQNQISQCSENIKDPDLAQKFEELMRKAYYINHIKKENGGTRCRSCDIVIEPKFDYCPCCERHLKNETEDYLKYLKKTNKGSTQEIEKAVKEWNHLMIDQISVE